MCCALNLGRLFSLGGESLGVSAGNISYRVPSKSLLPLGRHCSREKIDPFKEAGKG